MKGLTLLWSPRSPFARKVVMALDLMEILPDVELRLTRVAMTMPTDRVLLAENPLGKIPVLLVPNIGPIFDSHLITAWLDCEIPGILYPVSKIENLQAKRLEQLSGGLTDVLLLWRTEELKGSNKDPRITAGFEIKVRSSLHVLEELSFSLDARKPHVGQFALCCCLDQLDFRYPTCGWRDAFPTLASWHSEIGTHPVVIAHPIPKDLPDPNMGDVHMPLNFKEVN